MKRKILKTYPGKKRNELGQIFQYTGKTKTTYGYILELPRTPAGERNKVEKGGFPSISAALQAKRQVEKTTNATSATAQIEIYTLYDFFHKVFIPYLKSNNRAVGTVVGYESTMKIHAIKYFGENFKLHEISRKHFEGFKRYLQALDLKESTINTALKDIKNIFTVAVDLEYLDDNPFTGKYLEQELEPPTPYSDEDLDLIFKMIKSLPIDDTQKYLVPCYIMLYTGMRLGETLALTWDKIDFQNDIITVDSALKKDFNKKWTVGKTKGKYSRTVPLLPELKSILLDAQHQIKINMMKYGAEYIRSDFVCVYSKGGLVTHNTMSSLMQNMSHRGVNFNHHRFRDTFISRGINSNVNPYALMEIVGHKSLDVTLKHYTKIIDDTKSEVSNTIAQTIAIK